MSTRNKRILFVSVSVLIVVFGIIFPVYHFYPFPSNSEIPISVSNGYSNVTYSGDFRNNFTGNSYLMPSELVSATVNDTNHINSSLTLAIHKGHIYYDFVDTHIVIDYLLSVAGVFTTNLNPSSVTFSYSATGRSNQSGTILTTFAPPYSTAVPQGQNISVNKLGYLVLSGLGHNNVTVSLFNKSRSASLFHFSIASMEMEIVLNWYSNSTHIFDVGVTVNGLEKPVSAIISMEIDEVNE